MLAQLKDSTHHTTHQIFLSRNPTNTNPNLINQGFEGLNATNCGTGNPTNTNPNLINQGFEGLNATNCGTGLEIVA